MTEGLKTGCGLQEKLSWFLDGTNNPAVTQLGTVIG